MGVGDAMNIRNGGLPINVISVAAYRILNAKDVTFELGFIFVQSSARQENGIVWEAYAFTLLHDISFHFVWKVNLVDKFPEMLPNF